MAGIEQPVAFVTTKDDGSLVINQDVLDTLKTLHDKKVTVVAIVGEARKGKSFLMNRLMGSNKGFPLGPTVYSTTKGIWICMRPHPNDPSRMLVLLDTEGLGDPKKGDHTHDCWMFTLALLLSSAFVYNCMGSINQQALDFLQLAADMTERVKVKNTAEEESGEDFSKIFPELICVVRDFCLELKDPESGDAMTPDQYLESSLTLEKGYSKRAEEGNRLKRRLRDFFSKRSCFVMPRPVSKDEDMKTLEKLKERDLCKRFLKASKLFTDYVLEFGKNKTVDSVEISASHFATLAEQYVEAVQSRFVCIESAVNAIKTAANQKAMDEALQMFEQKLKNVELPLSPDKLKETAKPMYDCAMEHYLARVFGAGQDENLQLEITKRMTVLEKENIERCSEFCRDIIKELYEPIQTGLDLGEYMRPGGYNAFVQRVEDMRFAYRTDRRIEKLGWPAAEKELDDFVDNKVRSIAQVVLAGDVSLTRKEREVEAEKQRNERIKQEAEQEMKERDEVMVMVSDFHCKRLEDEAKARQEEKEAGLAMMARMKEQYDKLFEEKERLIREGNKKETDALRDRLKQLEKKIADLQTRYGDKKKGDKCKVQ